MANNSSNGSHYEVRPRDTDEIDLMEVFYKTSLIIRKYSSIILIAVATAAIIGIALKIFLRPQYKSTMVINTPQLGSEELTQIITSMDLRLDDPDFKMHGILTKLDVSANQADPKDRSYVITATVKDLNDLPKVRDYILTSLDNNDYIRKLKETELTRLKETLTGIENEEKRVAAVLNHTIKENLPNENFSVADLAKLKIDLMKQKAEVKATIENIAAVSIIKDFQPVKIPQNKRLILLFGVPLIACILIAASFIVFVELKEKLRDYETQMVRSQRVTTISPVKPIIKRTSYRPRVRQS